MTEKIRLALAKAILTQTQKRVGVNPVVEGYDDNLITVEDPEAEEGLEKFYESKDGRGTAQAVRFSGNHGDKGYRGVQAGVGGDSHNPSEDEALGGLDEVVQAPGRIVVYDEDDGW